MASPVTPLMRLDGEHVTHLLAPDGDAHLGVARTERSARVETVGGVAWVLVERGSGTLTLTGKGDGDGSTVSVPERTSVFDAPGWSATLGPGSSLTLDGDLSATVVWRATEQRATEQRATEHKVSTELIDPAEVSDELRGEGTTARRVRTYVPDGPLITGETINPPGGWSSWPPHRHQEEEAYLYRFEPQHGFGVHVGYDERDGDRPVIVRDGSVERIANGWHPVVAAPGCAMYYLWAIAGRGGPVDTTFDPRFD